MPEPTQFTLTHKELTELIIKHANVHEGRWMLNLTLSFALGNFGPSEDQLSPGTVVAVSQIGIQRETPEMVVPPNLMVDAAAVNPLRKREGQPAEKPVKRRKAEAS